MNTFTTNIQLVYILAAACFVVGLHLMNSPATARRGNQVSTVGMAIAVIATVFASANVVGGYMVTERMLKMFRRKAQPPVQAQVQAQPQAELDGKSRS